MKDSIYYRARAQASVQDSIYANRQRAAERLYVSAEALKDYETGETIPPCDVVQRMIEVYGADWLRAEHLKANCPMMADSAAETSELKQAALGWAVQIQGATELGNKFAQVAYDGHISEGEIAQAQIIRAKAVQLTRAMQSTIAAIDNALRGRR